jgi:hypothetical protein
MSPLISITISCFQNYALAGQSGYVYRFTIFGDNLNNIEEGLEDLEAGIGLSGKTVLDLVHDMPEGTQVFFDNFFSSPALLAKLK